MNRRSDNLSNNPGREISLHAIDIHDGVNIKNILSGNSFIGIVRKSALKALVKLVLNVK